MSYEITKLEQELLSTDLFFDEKNYSFSFHNHENLLINVINIFRDFNQDIKIEIKGKIFGSDNKYLDSLYGRKINLLLENKDTLDSYNISCIINRQIHSMNSDGHTFNFYGNVMEINYHNKNSKKLCILKEFYVYNDSNKLKQFNDIHYSIKDKYLVKHRKGTFYDGEFREYNFMTKIDLLNNYHSNYNVENIKYQKVNSMNNLLLSFNQNKFFVDLFKSSDDKNILIIEYNDKFGIPSENIRNKIYNLFSFLFGSLLIKISEKYYNFSYKLYKETVISPHKYNIDFALSNSFKPIYFMWDRDKFLKIFYDMSIIYDDKRYNFLDSVFKKYFYISSLEINSRIILLEALFDMIVKGYCYYMLNINQVFDDEYYYIKQRNKCIKKFSESVNLKKKNIDKDSKRVRNSVTHGDYQIAVEDLVKARSYYITLIHESILKILKYEGDFIDYLDYIN